MSEQIVNKIGKIEISQSLQSNLFDRKAVVLDLNKPNIGMSRPCISNKTLDSDNLDLVVWATVFETYKNAYHDAKQHNQAIKLTENEITIVLERYFRSKRKEHQSLRYHDWILYYNVRAEINGGKTKNLYELSY